MWHDHPEYTKMMEEFWVNIGARRGKWSEKLKSCKEMLKVWNKSTFGDVRKKIQGLKKELNEIKGGPRTSVMIDRERRIWKI
ncbi:hypothetical protein QQ045_015720 [Rhodiola kirilowii]